MAKKTATIANKAGIHVRPSGVIARELAKFNGTVYISRKRGSAGNTTDVFDPRTACKTALDIIAMGLTRNDHILIETEGFRDVETAAILAALFETEFDFPPGTTDSAC